VGAANGAATARSVSGWYLSLTAPPGTPPNWVFAPVWMALYVLIGVSAWLVWRRPAIGQRAALQLWGWQLLVNAIWPPIFFGLHSPALGMAAILLLLGMVGFTARAFAAIRPAAGALLLPYAAWTCYAAYLNAGFLWLNPG
jgi:tryptophan-rich sensory protein